MRVFLGQISSRFCQDFHICSGRLRFQIIKVEHFSGSSLLLTRPYRNNLIDVLVQKMGKFRSGKATEHNLDLLFCMTNFYNFDNIKVNHSGTAKYAI
jgi:hypothetical protein